MNSDEDMQTFLFVYQVLRTRPTFLKPNLRGDECGRRLASSRLCRHGLRLPLEAYSLIDITQNNLTMKLAVAALCATSAAAFAPSQVPAAVSN